MTDDKYASLRQALDAAHEQASQGKGRERHARDGQAFTKQPIMAITRMVGLGYPCGQAMKKLQESIGMAERGQHEAAQREMLGAINYAAAAWIRVGEMMEDDEPPVRLEASLSLDVAHLRKIVAALAEQGEDSEPPLPWSEVPDDFRWITRDADGTLEAWMDGRPSLTSTAGIWVGEVGGAGKCLGLRLTDYDEYEPKIWERPEMSDQPPVPWDQVPDDFRWITRDADGTLEAWREDGSPFLWDNRVWVGNLYEMVRLRGPDGGQHEPKIWERPE